MILLFVSVPPKSNLRCKPCRLAGSDKVRRLGTHLELLMSQNRRAGPGVANPSVGSQYRLNGLTVVVHFNILK